MGSEGGISADSGFPKFLWDPVLVVGCDGLPIGRRFGLEPIEVVDLVPLVVVRILASGQLRKLVLAFHLLG